MEQKSNKPSNLTVTLPSYILPGPSQSKNECEETIKNILTQDLPHSDKKEVNQQISWSFVLDKHTTNKIKSKQSKKKKYLTRKERKSKNLLKPFKNQEYETFKKINKIWKEYIRNALDLRNRPPPKNTDAEWNSFGASLGKIEFIGAEMMVVRASCSSLVGIAGIVVLETKLTFQLVNSKSKLKVIPKENCVFRFIVDEFKFMIFGNNLLTRPSERSSKKIKSQMILDI